MPGASDGASPLIHVLDEIVAGSLESLNEKDTYRPPARRSLTGHIQAVLPRLVRHLTELQRTEVQRRLATLVAGESDEVVRASLEATVRATQDAVRK